MPRPDVNVKRNKSSRRTQLQRARRLRSHGTSRAVTNLQRLPDGSCEIHGVIRIRFEAGTFDVHRARPGKSGGKLVHPLPGSSPERKCEPGLADDPYPRDAKNSVACGPGASKLEPTANVTRTVNPKSRQQREIEGARRARSRTRSQHGQTLAPYTMLTREIEQREIFISPIHPGFKGDGSVQTFRRGGSHGLPCGAENPWENRVRCDCFHPGRRGDARPIVTNVEAAHIVLELRKFGRRYRNDTAFGAEPVEATWAGDFPASFAISTTAWQWPGCAPKVLKRGRPSTADARR